DAAADGRQGHAMLARAGVTTALDLTGPASETLTIARTHGAGLNIAVLEAPAPGLHMPARPTRAQARDAIGDVLRGGAIGVKLHVDSGWGPEETATIVAEARALGAWVAVHCGTSATGSDLRGLAETIAIVGDASVQIAHVNSYCRGDTGDADDEARQAISMLRAAPHLLSESYLDRHNAAPGEFVHGAPASPRLVGWLERAGFPGTADGVRQALLTGWASIVVSTGGESSLTTGAAAAAEYERRAGRVVLCLPVNPPEPRVRLATSKTPGGRFDIDALATDGGGIPRNTTLSAGLALVELGYFTVGQLVAKASAVPAALLGLDTKGHLRVGGDADVVIVDPATRRVRMTIARGTVVFDDAVGARRAASRILTTSASAIAGDERLDLARSAQYDDARRKAITGR
ncbi:MAG: pyrC 2, partial [Microbacterium sp.]|uniref:amidohydrolase family protein n=1 Tax=Microbacterium sp. TaxID=51671 RepID=UPI002612654D